MLKKVKKVFQPNKRKAKGTQEQHEIADSARISSHSSFAGSTKDQPADVSAAANNSTTQGVAAERLQVPAFPAPLDPDNHPQPAPLPNIAPSPLGRLSPSAEATDLINSGLGLGPGNRNDEPSSVVIAPVALSIREPEGTGPAPEKPSLDKGKVIAPVEPGWKKAVVGKGTAVLKTLGAIAGVPANTFFEQTESSESDVSSIQAYCRHLRQSIEWLIDEEGSKVTDSLKSKLKELCIELDQESIEGGLEKMSYVITRKLELFMFVNRMTGLMRMMELGEKMEKHELAVRDLPRANAAFDDYTSKKRSGPCFEGTREALLTEIAEWIIGESGIYVLSGLAGIGKSTVAYTVAERAKSCGYLGASFFFSRDELNRRTAEKVFTTIAFQLCAYAKEFAGAIGGALLQGQGSAAVSKDPQDQLKALILDPLREVIESWDRPTVIVVDALDECEDGDARTVLLALNELVQVLPSFKVILTTRPQPHLQFLFDGSDHHTVFHLHNIEEKVIDHDVRLYLRHSLSREQVAIRLPSLWKPWHASDEEITSLVSATGRLFIIASTTVLFILDKTVSNPKSQMMKLLNAFAQDRTPLNALNNFYTIVLRCAVPENCDRDTVARFQAVIGTIVLMQEPLPLASLAALIDVEVEDVYAVISHLQSVILLSSDSVPLVYHKSFPDYIMDPRRCTDIDLCVVSLHHHTRIAMSCFELMNQCLKQNILELGGSSRLMANDEALANDNEMPGRSPDMLPSAGIGDQRGVQAIQTDKVKTKIPLELSYACTYWANHVEGGNAEDSDLKRELGIFFRKHLLHWFETLSWIRKLGVAHRAIRIVQIVMKSTSLEVQDLLSDGLRFVSAFYKVIEKTALHTYQKALPFVPTETTLYQKYRGQMSFCRVHGGPKKWEALISTAVHKDVDSITFSLDNSMFATLSNDQLKLWDAVTGIVMGTIGDAVTIAADFSLAASFKDDRISLYDPKNTALITTIRNSRNVHKLAISSNGHQIAVGSEDGTVRLWDKARGKMIASIDGWKRGYALTFSQNGGRLAFISDTGIKILEATSGELISELNRRCHRFLFSNDGSQIATLSSKGRSNRFHMAFTTWKDENTLGLWNCVTGEFVCAPEDVGSAVAISPSGSLVATAGEGYKIKLWSGNGDDPMSLFETLDLDLGVGASLEFSYDGVLAMASFSTGLIKLYDPRYRSFIATLPFSGPTSIALSSNSTRLAAGGNGKDIKLWDTLLVQALSHAPKYQTSAVTALVFSPDCSRLAAGFTNGTIKLWDTDDTRQPIATHEWPSEVTAIAFGINGQGLAFGLDDGLVMLRNSTDKDGELKGSAKCSGASRALALSNDTLACAMRDVITLWDLETLSTIGTLNQPGSLLMSFSHTGSLLATSSLYGWAIVWDVAKRLKIVRAENEGMMNVAVRTVFSADDTQLAALLYACGMGLCDIASGNVTPLSKSQASQLRLIPCWNGNPVLLERVFGDVYSVSISRFISIIDRSAELAIHTQM